jgi:leucyl-tRNA synthetase
MVVQINGKVRSRIEIDLNTTEAEAEALALGDPTIVGALGGVGVKRVVARPPRLVNVIV